MSCPLHWMHVISTYQVISAVLWLVQHYVISCSLYHCFITVQHSQYTACLPKSHQGLIWHLNKTPRLCLCWPILSHASSIKRSNNTREIHPGHACLTPSLSLSISSKILKASSGLYLLLPSRYPKSKWIYCLVQHMLVGLHYHTSIETVRVWPTAATHPEEWPCICSVYFYPLTQKWEARTPPRY